MGSSTEALLSVYVVNRLSPVHNSTNKVQTIEVEGLGGTIPQSQPNVAAATMETDLV